MDEKNNELRFRLAYFKVKKPIASFDVGSHMELVVHYKSTTDYSAGYRTNVVLLAGVMGEFVLPPSLINDRDYLIHKDCSLDESFKRLGFPNLTMKLNSWETDKYLDKDFLDGIGKLIHLYYRKHEIFDDYIKKIKQ